MTQWIEFLIELIVLLLTLATVMARMGFKFKKNEERFSVILKAEFHDTKNEVTELRRDINKVIIDRSFRKSLQNNIKAEATIFVQRNKGTSQKYKDVLMFFGNEINELASNWYNSEFRGVENKKEMEKYLSSWIEGRLGVANHFINATIKQVKLLTDRDRTGILFSEFIEKNGLYIQFEVLIGTLARNGFFDNDEIIKEFTNFVVDFFDKFLSLQLVWDTLKNKVYEDHK